MNGVIRPDGVPPAPGALHPGHPRAGRCAARQTARGCRSSRCWSAAARRSCASWPPGTTSPTTPPTCDAALADPRWEIYADFLVTKARVAAIRKAIAAGKAIYTEKPTAESVPEALELAALARAAGVKNGVVHDKLYLPGLRKLARLIDSGFFGRILSVRGEFGYWVFEGDWQPAQRPSWNYRAEDGGGIVVDMFPHWNYVLENLFGRSGRCTRGPSRTSRPASTRPGALPGHRRRRRLRGVRAGRRRDRPAELQLDGAGEPQGAGRVPGRRHPRQRGRRAVRLPRSSRATPPRSRSGTRTWPTPTTTTGDWIEVPDNDEFEQRVQGRSGSSSSGTSSRTPRTSYDLLAGARGVRLAEAGLASSRTGDRMDLPELALPALPTPDPPSRPPRSSPRRRWAAVSTATAVDASGRVDRWELAGTACLPPPARTPLRCRVAYAAAHVVPRVAAENVPGAPADLDWDATLAFRHHLWSWGLGVADAMDTAQRNMGLDAAATRELISPLRRRGALGRRRPGGRREHRPRAGRGHLAAAGRRRLRRAAAVRGGRRRRHRADGQPAPGPGRLVGRRLRTRLRRGAVPGRGAGRAALVGRRVRPTAGRLLRLARRPDEHRHRDPDHGRRTPTGSAGSR